jgi:LysM repeat protein
MKATALHVILCLVLGSPAAFSKTESQARCEHCAQQDRKISELQSENDRLKGLKETPNLKAEASSYEKATTTTYRVRPGDTLERIARQTGCSTLALGKANGLKSSSIIHPDQTLKVPTGSAAPALAEKSASSATTYVIRDGDTFTSISKKTGVSINSLAAANPKTKPTSLRAGQVLQLGKPAAPEAIAKSVQSNPVRTISTPAAKTISNPEPRVMPDHQKPEATKPAPALKPAPAPGAAKPAPPAVPEAPSSPPMGNAKKTVRAILIQDETSFAEFAAAHGTTPESLNDLNGLSLSNGTVLAKGSELYIPAQP